MDGQVRVLPEQAQGGLLTVIQQLRREYAEGSVSEARGIREQHGHGESHHPTAAPEAVFFAINTEAVARAAALCHEARVPMVPFGQGTSLEGHVAALDGGLCIDLTAMDCILRVSPNDLDCQVQCGVTRKRLNQVLGKDGMFFPVDPGADASIGGMASTGACGTNAVGYGTMAQIKSALDPRGVLNPGKVVSHPGGSR